MKRVVFKLWGGTKRGMNHGNGRGEYQSWKLKFLRLKRIVGSNDECFLRRGKDDW